MIDLLVWGAANIYNKFQNKHRGTGQWSPDQAREAMVELAKACEEESEIVATCLEGIEGKIQGINDQLRGLVPQSVTAELDNIALWMKQHVASEQQILRDLARKQQWWNYGTAAAAFSALIIAVLWHH